MATTIALQQAESERLDRKVLTISRLLDYFSESELTTQTGYSKERWWPEVVAKELIDNALDACEQNEVAPVINVRIDKRGILVSDNGPGIGKDTVEQTLDFSTRTSEKVAYISPTRGAQGNALKTILAIPHILSGTKQATVVEISARGVQHRIEVSTSIMEEKPSIRYRAAKIVRTKGTRVLVKRVSACCQTVEEEREILQKLVLQYSLFNPHATFILNGKKLQSWSPDWQKWLPTSPPAPHWYDKTQLGYLVGACARANPSMTVRDFVAKNFRGLSATAKQAKVCERAGLSRARLSELNSSSIKRLLRAMVEESKPVKPEAFGILGSEYLSQRVTPEGETFRYAGQSGSDTSDPARDGRPYLVECAFAQVSEDSPLRGLHVGLNWSVPLDQPFQSTEFEVLERHALYRANGLADLLARGHIDIDEDPVCLVVHVVYPRFTFLDRGKGNVDLDEQIAQAVQEAVQKVTKSWSRIKQKEFRERQRSVAERKRYLCGGSRVTTKAAGYEVMSDAYAAASESGELNVRRLKVRPRQVMYAGRGRILELTGKDTLDDDYFTQRILPDYVREHPDETADWDIVYDERGHLLEPHTAHTIGLGTVEVREYLADAAEPVDLSLQRPDVTHALIATKGPTHRYGALLYIEKEGFFPLFEQVKLAERYDLAIASGKGMSTVAARTLIEHLADDVKILVLHDFDKSGFSILGTLTRDTRRYEFKRVPEVIDLGLRLDDVKKWRLQSEPVGYTSDPTANLRENGATDEEIDFLFSDEDELRGERVELNAFTSKQLIAWVEQKLKAHGVKKVIPALSVLEQTYRRVVASNLYQRMLDEHREEIEGLARQAALPDNLRSRVAAELKSDPTLPWDAAMTRIFSTKRAA